MKWVQKTTLTLADKHSVLEIWNAEYPVTIQHKDLAALENYLSGLDDINHYLVYDQDGVIAWMPVFTRHQERWFAILICNNQQGKGLGRQLLTKAMEQEEILNGWVVDKDHFTRADGEPYASPLQFYLQQGFQVLADERLDNEKLSSVKIRWKRS